MLDLQRRVEKILIGAASPPAVLSPEDLSAADQNLSPPKTTSSSQPSLSPRSSLSSVSPPVSPYDPPPPLPPSYEQAFLGSAERGRRAAHPPNLQLPEAEITETRRTLQHSPLSPGCPPYGRSTHSPVKRSPTNLKPCRELELTDLPPYSCPPPSLLLNRRGGHDSVGGDQSAPLSPISESAVDDRKAGGSGPRSVSAAVSDESVAGDSGVFEAAGRKEDLGLAMNLETAQVQIKLRYSSTDSLLHIGIERARNLAVLFIPEGRQV